jgi:hypothetical protein
MLLDVGRNLAAGPTEAYWRSSVGRVHYALLHEVLGTLRRWGFALPPRDKVHTFARLKFVYASDPDLKRIGLTLEALAQLHNTADYQLGTSGPFVSPRIAVSALADTQSAVLVAHRSLTMESSAGIGSLAVAFLSRSFRWLTYSVIDWLYGVRSPFDTACRQFL